MNSLYLAFLQGYLLSCLIETVVLICTLSKKYSLSKKILAGFFLTACSYPVVVLLLPQLISPYTMTAAYYVVAEFFAAISEIVIFFLLFSSNKNILRSENRQDLIAIILANLVSFISGELLKASGFHFG